MSADEHLDRIGIIGLGKMGAPMARRLLAAGHRLAAYDIRPEALTDLARQGATVCAAVREVPSGADVVITMLPDPPAVERVAYVDGLLDAMRGGQILIEMTSSHPRTTRRLAADLAAKGVRVLDAPVSGGVTGAVEGTLCIIAGGPADLLEACRPILERLGRTVVHVGDAPGDGDIAKTINNLLSATTTWSVAEALALAGRSGLAPARVIEAVNRSTGRSHTTELKAPRYILPRDFSSGFTVAQYLKDLDICLDLADDLKVPMPLGAMLRQLWRVAAREGLAEADHTALVRLTERWAGLAEER
jgi:3-hydroxyisobutyrate dehydrogenase